MPAKARLQAIPVEQRRKRTHRPAILNRSTSFGGIGISGSGQADDALCQGPVKVS